MRLLSWITGWRRLQVAARVLAGRLTAVRACRKILRQVAAKDFSRWEAELTHGRPLPGSRGRMQAPGVGSLLEVDFREEGQLSTNPRTDTAMCRELSIFDGCSVVQSQNGAQSAQHGKLKGHVETDEQWLHRQQQAWYYRYHGLRCVLRLTCEWTCLWVTQYSQRSSSSLEPTLK